MRFVTKSSLKARTAHSSTVIFVPPGEVIETKRDDRRDADVAFAWRGLQLIADGDDVLVATGSAPAVQPWKLSA